MKYSTFEQLKNSCKNNPSIAEDVSVFDNAMSSAKQTDFLGCSLLRSCMSTDAFSQLKTCDDDALDKTLEALVAELCTNHGLKPYHATWAASAWCSVLRVPMFFEYEAYTKELESAEFSDCVDRASHGDAYAAVEVSVRYSGGEKGVSEPNENESDKWMAMAADLMHSIAAEIVAELWSEDETKQKQAFEMLSKQAEFAPSNGCLALLGKFYRDGIGCQEDGKKAFETFQKGADKNLDCLCRLGECYLTGIGCEENHEKAFECFNLGAQYESAECAEYVYLMICDGEVEASPEVKFQYLDQAVSGGCIDEISDLAIMYINGDGVPKDEQKGFKLLEDGTREGVPEAIGWLGGCYLSGIGTEIDREKGLYLLKTAAEEYDDLRSCIMLTKLYRARLIKCTAPDAMADIYQKKAYELGASDSDFE